MTATMSQAWKIVKPHVPLIRFRKGTSEAAASIASPKQTTSAPVTSGKAGNNIISRPIIEDWQLPLRYRRQALDEKEIDAINSGGAY